MLKNVLVALFVLFTASVSVADEWSSVEYRDQTNADLVSGARITNSDGFSITIFRNNDSKVRWELALPGNSFDRLTTRGRVASFFVDDGETRDIEFTNSRLLVDGIVVSGRAVRSLLWHGEGPSPTRGTLRNLLDGGRLNIRFFTDSGEKLDTSFTISDGKSSIAEALSISLNAGDTNAEVDRDEAIILAATVCMASAAPAQCAGVLADCMVDTSSLTSAKLKTCMRNSGYPYD